MIDLLLLEQAANAVILNCSEKPSPDQLVEVLLDAEKTARQQKKQSNFEELLGTWRLCFVTGTKKARNRAGIVLGSGRYLPNWVRIYLCYSPERIENRVDLGFVKFSLTGPVKFLTPKNLLVFDFTYLIVQVFGVKVYDGYVRGGKISEENFAQESVKKQAFFAYFLLQGKIIAARGRGGGLALWGR